MRATFDGWELALGDAPGAENAWSTEPRSGEGLLVDSAYAVPDGARSVCLVRAKLPAQALAALVGRVEQLALIDCTLAGGFDAVAASGLSALWIRGPEKLTARTLTPLGRATRLDTLHLDGVAPATLFRWLAPLTTLRRLDLSRPDDDADPGRGLAALAPLAQLEQLGLRRAQITAGAVAHIAALPSLRRLDLSYGLLSAPAKAWRKLKHIEVLRLRNLRGYWWPAVENLLREMTGLVAVDLRGQQVNRSMRDTLRADMTAIRFDLDPLPEPAPSPAASRAGVTGTVLPLSPEPPLPVEWCTFPDGAPTLPELHVVFTGERGQPEGYDRRHDLLTVAARYHPQQLVESLSMQLGTEPLLVLLTLIAPTLQHFDPNAQRWTNRAIDALRALLDDPRALDWRWADMDHQTARFVVGRVASAALLDLLRFRAQRRRSTLAADWPLLDTILRAELRREAGEPYVVTAHLGSYTHDPEFPVVLAAWLASMTSIIDDAAALPRARSAALERLSRDIDTFLRSHPEPATTIWRRTLASLAESAVSPATEMRFRRAARKLVAARAPELFDAMRASGALPGRALPDYAQLVDGIGRPSDERVLPIAPDVDGATCVAALRSSDVESWFAALALAPYCGDAAEARTCAELATELVGRDERIAIEDGPCTESCWLGDLAAGTLTALVRRRAVPIDGLFEQVLARVSAAPISRWLTTPPGLHTALDATAPANGNELLLRRFLDRAVPASERFALMLLSFPIRRDHAQRVLQDEAEDGELRALVGCLSGLVQPAGARPLPLIEPDADVTLENLMRSLELGRHRACVGRATSQLVGRLLPWDREAEYSAGVATLRRIPPPALLRELADADAPDRDAASRWLAVLGAHEDEGRIARYMVEGGGWTATRPQGRMLETPIQRMLAALVPESVVDYCDSSLDPLLVIGYGESGAARIRAKAYALIARRHAEAGRLPFARRSMEYAARLDPMNLDVARLRRTLGE